MCQPYKASATALSDCYIDDEEIAKNSGFCRASRVWLDPEM